MKERYREPDGTSSAIADDGDMSRYVAIATCDFTRVIHPALRSLHLTLFKYTMYVTISQ